jgi:signal transduction histidine kinase/CHASE3 domain sensor protein
MPFRTRGLRARIALASLLLGVVFAGAFFLLGVADQHLRRSARDSRHSEQVVALANRLEKLLLDLETGERGYVITRQDRFLQPYRAAVAAVPSTVDSLSRLVGNDPLQRARVAAISRRIDEYENRWVRRVVAVAHRDPAAANALVATADGKRRVDAMRGMFARFLATQQRLSAAGGRQADSQGRQAIELGIAGVAGSAILIIVYASFLLRLVSAPVQRVAAGARRIAGGDFSVRVPERGVGEIGELARDFNVMASSLDMQRARLAQQNAELQAVLDATLDGICVTDVAGNLLFANRKMDRFWGERGLPSTGTMWDRLAHVARQTTSPEQYFPMFEQMVADPLCEVDAEFTLAADRRSFVGHTEPVKDSSGALVGRIFSVREVTAERKAERMKDEFVATVSHELRTPLTSIVGYVELVRDPVDGALDPLQDEYLKVVERNARRLERLVGDLLFFAQVEAGRLELDLGPVDLCALARTAIDATRPVADDKNVRLELDCTTPGDIEGDPGRIEQLLDNLVSNAVKFTPNGGRVDVCIRPDGDEVLLEVSDSGIGIPKAEVGRLFQRFFRASSATSREIQGTGLGLAIAKTIVEAHGGVIGVESEAGYGTTFTVRLPVRRPAAVGAAVSARV